MAKPVFTPRKCIFCGAQKNITREHVIPDWVRNVIPRTSTLHHHIQVTGNPNQPDAPTATLKNSDSNLGVKRILRVCVNCNTGWMHDLQDRTKPILAPLMQGNWHEITEPEAAQIAIWMAMTTAVIAMSFKNSSTPFADRQHIASTLTVPAHWQIWIGRGSGFGEMYYSNRVCQLQMGSERAVKAGEINTGVTTVALGQLLLHCINVPIRELTPDPVLYGWMQGLLPIHPWGGDTLEIASLPFIRDKSPEYHRLADGYFSEILMPLGRR